ncbi:helix-turn-helix domain-containing protein [Streptomyces flaveolus]|uniref:helix-turn-helix domain-containing protein n=1 Tax=Streptomyces flaveolus TaxID=67297 RepID=UPI0033DE6CA5
MFDTEDWPLEDRVDAWQESVGRSLMSNQISVDSPAEFRASLRAAELGLAQLAAVNYSSMTVRRPVQLIGSGDPELYCLALVSRGRQVIHQSRREAVGEAGSLVVYASTKPYEVRVDSGQGTAACLVTQVPRSLLPFSQDRLEGLLATQFPTGEGMGALLAQVLTHLATDTSPYRPADAPRLGTVLLDLLTTVMGHYLDDGAVPPESRHRALYLRIQAFIQQNLGDPELTPDDIAAAHRISTRQLHRLFQGQGLSVSGWIRQCRLEHCRRDLSDPHHNDLPIHAIAARWGLPNAALFSRAFTAAYGMPPSEYRRQTRSSQARSDKDSGAPR